MSQRSVKDVLSEDKFSIPQYQRDYAWKKENLEDLWEDLQEAINAREDSKHFLGTIVVSPKNENGLKKFDVIDGQQRLTTIFMLLHALIDRSEFKESYRAKFLLDIRGKLKLEVAPQNHDFFEELLQESSKKIKLKGNLSKELEDKADTQGKKNFFEVMKAILDKVSSIKESEVENYIETLRSMTLMWLSEQDSGSAIRTFQSVNDRGVPLKLLDKLKSLLIYYSNLYCNGNEGLDEQINDKFGEIFRIFLKIEEHRHISSIGN